MFHGSPLRIHSLPSFGLGQRNRSGRTLRQSLSVARRRPRPLVLEALEERTLLAAPFSEFVDPNPNVGNQFGAKVVTLSTGNVVITSPFDDFGGTDAGAVYLFNGATGALISTLRGSSANGSVGSGGVTALSNGNYVVRSFNWDNGAATNAGAVTFGSGTTGVSGVITATNSALGLTASTNLQAVVVDNTNSTFFGRFLAEGGGKVRVGSQVDGFAVTTTPVNLSVSASAGTEVGQTQITVTLTAASAVSGDQTVNLVVTGTGISSGDFSLTDGDAAAGIHIKILNGQTTGTVTFTVKDDLLNEGSETATLTISSPSAGITLGTTTTQNIAISDDDNAATSTYRVPVAGSYRVELNGGTVELYDSGNSLVASRPIGTAAIVINGIDAANDNLTVNFSGGNLIPSGGLTFNGGTGGTGFFGNVGINIDNADVTVVDVDLQIMGTGGAGTNIANAGVFIGQSSALVRSTGTGASAGSITILGTGGSGTDSNRGVVIFSSGLVSSGDGAVTISGTATDASGTGQDGINLQSSGQLNTTGTASVLLTGTAGNTSSFGITLQNPSSLTLTGATNTLVADSVNIDTTGGTIAAGANTVTVRPQTGGTTINLAGADAVGTLGLTDAELDRITAGTISIGDANNGAISVSGDITRSAATVMNLTGGGAISFAGGQFVSGGGNVNLNAGTTIGVVGSGAGVQPDVVTAGGSLSFGSGDDLSIVINGTTADTQYTQFDVSVDSVMNLTGLDLVLSGGYMPTAGDSFTIVDNSGSGTTTGTFNGLPEGTLVNVKGTIKKITYVGGTGNDVVLGPANTLTASIVGNDLVIKDLDETGKNNVLSLSRSGANLVISDANEIFATVIAGAVLSNGNKTVTVPVSALGAGGKIIVKGQGGSDSLGVDVSTDLGFDMDYQGGTGTSDSLTLASDTVTNVTHAFTNANDGSVTIVDGGSRLITYTGLEPVTDNLSATDRVFTFNGGAETITLADATGANMTIDSTLGESVTFANPTGSLTINAGTGDDTVTLTSVDTDGPFGTALTINGDAGSETVNLNADITFAAGNSLDVNLTNDAMAGDLDQISVGTNANIATSGTGTIDLRVSRSIAMSGGSSLATVNGGITLEANTDGAAAGNFDGINLGSGASLASTGSGNISLTAQGGDLTGSSGHRGIRLDGASVTSTGSGTITLTGTGGTSSGQSNGVVIRTSSLVESASGAITLNGTGGTAASGVENQGILIEGSSTVRSTGTGASAADVTLVGTGGTGFQDNAGVFISGSTVTVVDGDLQITGTNGTGAGGRNGGVGIFGSAVVSSTGSGASAGTITILGTGGGGLVSNVGVQVTGQVSSVDGAVSITGVVTGATPTTGQNGIQFGSGGQLNTTGTASVLLSGTAGNATSFGIALANPSSLTLSGTSNTLVADSMSIDTTGATINGGSNTITLRQKTNGTTIDLGGADSAGTLGFSDAELDRITAGLIVVGDSNEGAVTFSAAIDLANSNTLEVITGSTINDTGSSTVFTDTSLALNAALGVGTSSTLNVAVTNFAANTAAGGLNITNASNLKLTAVGSLSGVSSTSGDVSITASGQILVNSAVSATGTGMITLDAQGGDLGTISVKSPVTSESGAITLKSDNDISATISGTIGTVSGLVSLIADEDVSSNGTISYSAAVNHGSAGSTWSLADAGGSMSGVISGSGGLTKIGTGTLTLSGLSANTYVGTTQVNAGTLRVTVNNALGSTAGGTTVLATLAFDNVNYSTAEPVTLNGGVLRDFGPSTFAGDVTLAADSFVLVNNTLTLTGQVTGGFGFTKQSGGVLVLTNPANNYGGGTTLASGTLRLGAAGVDPNTSDVEVQPSTTLDLNGFNETIDGLSQSGTVTSGVAGSVTLTVGANNESAAGFGGVIQDGSGTVALTKTGSGTQTLAGANTYTGATSVSGGTLLVNGSTAAGSAVTVSSGGTLGGTGTVGGSVMLAGGAPGGTVAPGTSPECLDTGSVTFDSGSTLAIEIDGTTACTQYDRLAVTGSATLGDATLSLSGSHTPVSGNSFTILTTTTGVSGTFNGLADGATVLFNLQPLEIDYQTNDVVLTFDSTPVIDGDNANNTFEVREDAGGNIEVLGDSVLIFEAPLANLTSLTLNGSGGDDTFTVNFAGGGGFFVLPNTINGDGQTTSPNGDTLIFSAATATSVTHTFTNANDGSVSVVSGSTTTVNYIGLEPVTDNLSATNRVFTFTGGAETITLTDASGANMTINSTLGESVTFANPTGSLTINAGTGDDTVTITSVDADGPFVAALTINGDAGSDTVNLNADITFASGNSLDVNLTNDAMAGDLDQISTGMNANIVTSGTGSIDLEASRNITMNSGSSLAAVNGGITPAGNAAGTAGNTSSFGINLANGSSLTLSGASNNFMADSMSIDTTGATIIGRVEHGLATTEDQRHGDRPRRRRCRRHARPDRRGTRPNHRGPDCSGRLQLWSRDVQRGN